VRYNNWRKIINLFLLFASSYE